MAESCEGPIAMSNSRTLVGVQRCLELLFPDEASRPGIRTFREWQSRGYLPYHKIGRRTFFDVDEVRAALDRKFRIHAR